MSDDPTKKLPLTTDEMLGKILVRLETLETSVDQRLRQTTPLSTQLADLFERMETGFREAGESQSRLEREFREFGERFGTEMRKFGQSQNRFETEMREFGQRQERTEKELREINRTLRRMNVDLATALRDQDELGDRITAIETHMSQP